MCYAGSEPLTFYNPTSSASFGESFSSETLVVVKPIIVKCEHFLHFLRLKVGFPTKLDPEYRYKTWNLGMQQYFIK